MKKNKHIEFLTLILSLNIIGFFTFSCNDNGSKTREINQNNVEIIHIDPITNNWDKVDDIIEEVKLTPLETTPGSLVGEIRDVQFQKNRIFLLDQSNKEIKIFNIIDGSFIGKISREGRGPEEYINIDGFSLCENDSLVEIYDNRNFSFITYNLDNEFIKRQKINYMVSDFRNAFGDKKIVYTGFLPSYQMESFPSLSRLLFFDKDSKLYKTALPFNYKEDSQIQFFTRPSNHLSFYKDTIVLAGEKLSYDIYHIWKDSIKKKYHIDFGKYSVPVNYWSSEKELKDFRESNKMDNSPFISVVLESDNYIYIRYAFKGAICFYLYNKTEQLGYNIPLYFTRKSDNLNLPMPRYKWDDYFVGITDAYLIKNQIKGYKNNDRDIPYPLKGIDDKISKQDNPILFLIKWN